MNSIQNFVAKGIAAQTAVDTVLATIGIGADATASAEPPKGSKSNPVGIVKRSNSYYVDPRAVSRKEGFNPRFDFGEIEELAKSIKANGLLQPLRVQRAGVGKFVLVDGERRFTAIELIMKKEPDYFAEGVHAIIVDAAQDDLTSLIQMFEANTGKNFLPMEEAIAYKRMRDAGMTLKQIEKAVQRKHVHIVATLALLEADDDLQQAVKDGTIGATMAKKIATAARGDKAAQKALVVDAKAAQSTKGTAAKTKASKAVKAKIEAARVAAAKKAGRKLKMRALTDDQLGVLGEKLSGYLMEQMAAIGLDPESDLVKWMRGADDDCKVAFTFGTLQAMKAAAGLDDTVLIF